MVSFSGFGVWCPLGVSPGSVGCCPGGPGMAKSGILLFLDFLGRYPVGPGGVLGGHRISDFGGGVAWDSRLNVNGILR